jgi:formamidopyrimidine-DNA glycosylase
MDQSVIAGIGNLYSDEILFHCGVHPDRTLNKFSESKLKELFDSMKRILKDSVKYESAGSNFPDDYLLNNRKNNSGCPVCGGVIKMKTIAGRSSYFCKKHQK